MKITKQYLTQLIKEELEQTLNEYNTNSPVVHKVSSFSASWSNPKDAGPGNHIGNEFLDHAATEKAPYDDKLMELIRVNNDPKKALKTINNLADRDEVDIPTALAALVIAQRHARSNTEEGLEVARAYTNKLEGPKFEYPNYFTVGPGSQEGMHEKFKVVFPELMKAVKDSKTKYDYPPGQYTPRKDR
jgi:hypothetical protein